MTRSVGSTAARALIFVIQLYRNTISPLRLPTCRFTPTCSQYAVDALGEYGLVKGGWLAVVRLLKCGPWHRGGWDPIPERQGGEAESCAAAGENSDDPNIAGGSGGIPAPPEESETRV
ncbi:membrane protein insertion efficiency factor YidD [Mycolicibacterium sp. XJ1819]